MKNPYYYLFYRLNNLYNKKGDNEWGPIFGVTVFIGWNLVIIYLMLLPIDKNNFDGIYKIILIVIIASLFILNSILFLNKKRVERIGESYRKESKTNKRIGGVLVVLYVILSLGLIVFI